MELIAIILAAGEGKRMKSALPKVLHPVAGRPMLGHVLETCDELGADRKLVVVGRGREAVESWLDGRAETVHQIEQLGTAHAVLAARPSLAEETAVFVLSGDTPLITAATLSEVFERFKSGRPAAVMVTGDLAEPFGYGRIFRDSSGAVSRIVEEKDATAEEKAVTEVNTGIYCFDREKLFEALGEIDDDNQQGEYYLTDVVAVLRAAGETVMTVKAEADEVMGVNSRVDLVEVERTMQSRLRRGLMDAGVTFIMPETTYLAVDVEIGRDTVVLPQCFLESGTRVGEGARIGPGVRLAGTQVGDGAEVSYSVLRDCEIGMQARVGPYCSLRPGTVLLDGVKAGTFVEIKNTEVGAGSKVPHLSYMGDAVIGEDVNVGAGSITCNYDGAEKHRTVIEDRAFLGSDTMLIAPVNIGKGAATGAGSSISHDVPADSLAVERAEQRTIPGWAKRRRAKRK